MWAIIKKEVKSYFLSPIAYIFIGLFLLMSSIFFYLDVYVSGIVNLEYMFYSLSTILTFVIPILTMRMFSEERKTGTEQILYTSPRSITSIVLGKFISAIVVMVVCEICTLLYLAILMYFGKPHISTILITLLGFLLLSMAYIAFGMFASSITENQIIAGVITIAGFLVIWFMPGFYDKLSIFSLINVFSNTFPQGIITYQAITLFMSFTILFIILTITVIARRKSVK
ncbi:MAG: ABC transporter permease subunit [Clostridia bacterium]|nr:ABC transporter permease subunit [Clostridia bacterium]